VKGQGAIRPRSNRFRRGGTIPYGNTARSFGVRQLAAAFSQPACWLEFLIAEVENRLRLVPLFNLPQASLREGKRRLAQTPALGSLWVAVGADFAPFAADTLSCYFRFFIVFCNWLLFEMFSALAGEKLLCSPFVFSMFSALDRLSIGGQKVTRNSGVRQRLHHSLFPPFQKPHALRTSCWKRCRRGALLSCPHVVAYNYPVVKRKMRRRGGGAGGRRVKRCAFVIAAN
jgi:hypothetical protein